MPSPLPIDNAIQQLHDAMTVYTRALNAYDTHDPTPKRWNAIADAYMKLSAAHWELDQIHKRSNGGA